MSMIDSQGFRYNVGIVICNNLGQLLWAKRIKQSAWQFPQGGIREAETLEQAMYRELNEEVGLNDRDVKILHKTANWLHYRLPNNLIRYHADPLCIGQKQKWFLLSLESDESQVELSNSVDPEFDDWCWVNYWYPVKKVIEFKRDVYRKALAELEEPFNCYIKCL